VYPLVIETRSRHTHPICPDLLFDLVVVKFERYDNQQISFVDHTSAVLAREYEIEHIFAFDRDFTTLGLTRVPADIHFPE
jgi:uncharacterized protein